MKKTNWLLTNVYEIEEEEVGQQTIYKCYSQVNERRQKMKNIE